MHSSAAKFVGQDCNFNYTWLTNQPVFSDPPGSPRIQNNSEEERLSIRSWLFRD